MSQFKTSNPSFNFDKFVQELDRRLSDTDLERTMTLSDLDLQIVKTHPRPKSGKGKQK